MMRDVPRAAFVAHAVVKYPTTKPRVSLRAWMRCNSLWSRGNSLKSGRNSFTGWYVMESCPTSAASCSIDPPRGKYGFKKQVKHGKRRSILQHWHHRVTRSSRKSKGINDRRPRAACPENPSKLGRYETNLQTDLRESICLLVPLLRRRRACLP